MYRIGVLKGRKCETEIHKCLLMQSSNFFSFKAAGFIFIQNFTYQISMYLFLKIFHSVETQKFRFVLDGFFL